MKRCRTCLYPDSKPDLFFDETGECSACTSFQKRSDVDWDARLVELRSVLDRVNGRVIVPSSGGKDSSYIALRLKELGADVTAVTASTCMLTPIGRLNIDNLARHVRTIEVTPNMTVRWKLNRLALELVGDPSWAEHVSIHRVPFRVALETKTHAIFYGEAPNNQYGGPPGTESTRVMTQRWASEFAGFLGLRVQDLIGKEGLTERDMRDYMAPTDAELLAANVTAYFLGAFEPWDSHRNARIAANAGMKQERPSPANWWSHENLDSALTGLHDAMMFRKYGYGRGCAQISVDIRAGLISRESALHWVRENDGIFPYSYAGVNLHEVLERIGITSEQLFDIMERFTNYEIIDSTRNFRPMLKEFACSQPA